MLLIGIQVAIAIFESEANPQPSTSWTGLSVLQPLTLNFGMASSACQLRGLAAPRTLQPRTKRDSTLRHFPKPCPAVAGVHSYPPAAVWAYDPVDRCPASVPVSRAVVALSGDAL